VFHNISGLANDLLESRQGQNGLKRSKNTSSLISLNSGWKQKNIDPVKEEKETGSKNC